MCVCVRVSVCVGVCGCVSVSVSVYVSVSVSVCVLLCVFFVCFSVCEYLSVSVSLSLSASWSIFASPPSESASVSVCAFVSCATIRCQRNVNNTNKARRIGTSTAGRTREARSVVDGISVRSLLMGYSISSP